VSEARLEIGEPLADGRFELRRLPDGLTLSARSWDDVWAVCPEIGVPWTSVKFRDADVRDLVLKAWGSPPDMPPLPGATPAGWVHAFDFGEDFQDLRDEAEADHAQSLKAELDAELAPGHRLHGQACRVVARALPQDEIVVVAGESVALVHLTWSGHPETPPWPATDLADSAVAFQELIKFRY
jgi:hypothetical protein